MDEKSKLRGQLAELGAEVSKNMVRTEAIHEIQEEIVALIGKIADFLSSVIRRQQ